MSNTLNISKPFGYSKNNQAIGAADLYEIGLNQPPSISCIS